MKKRLVFQLGTNNWRRQGGSESGLELVHEAHHKAFDAIPNTTSYSVYPSSTQSSHDPYVKILPLTYDAPVYEPVAPASAYRFHSMSDAEFFDFKSRLKAFTADAIAAAEEHEGNFIDLAIAHHCFINPLILSELNAERVAAGKPRFKILCFSHDTALRMFAREAAGTDPEYAKRFLPMIERCGLFGLNSPIDLCAADSNDQLAIFSSLFPQFDRGRLLLSTNGYSSTIFKPNDAAYRERKSVLAGIELPIGPLEKSPREFSGEVEKVVVFAGELVDWKRMDALLHAAVEYEEAQKATTLIIGSGPKEVVRHYHELAYERLGLKDVWFLGRLTHTELARMNALADIVVCSSTKEPFGLASIEAMGCGTPVIGANSRGARDFVSDAVGALVDEGQGFDQRLGQMIRQALMEDWKASKGPVAAAFASSRFSMKRQCEQILARADNLGSDEALSAG